MIYVTDELVNKQVVDIVASNFRHFLWEYGNVGSPESPMFFGRVLYHKDRSTNVEYDSNIDIIVNAGKDFLKQRLHHVKDIVLHRILVNGQLPNMIAAPHVDWEGPDMATMVYYVSNSQGGGTQMFDADGNTADFVDFKQGRSIFFPSMFLHEGVAPTTGWRISLGIMYRLILEDNKDGS
jgi:hypothetical protein